jgi:hypothetical protein
VNSRIPRNSIHHPTRIRERLVRMLCSREPGGAQTATPPASSPSTAHEDFLDRWKDVNAEIPIQNEAKVESMKLQSLLPSPSRDSQCAGFNQQAFPLKTLGFRKSFSQALCSGSRWRIAFCQNENSAPAWLFLKPILSGHRDRYFLADPDD